MFSWLCFYQFVYGSIHFANPPVPVIKRFQNERTSGVFKIFKIKEPFILGFWIFLESMNLEFQVFENSQRTSGLYEGQAKNSQFRAGSLMQCFDFVEPQVRVETGSTTSENHWLRVKTSYLTCDNCGSRVYTCPTITHMRSYLPPSSSVWHLFHWALSPIKLCVALVSSSSVPPYRGLSGTCFIELCYHHWAVWCLFHLSSCTWFFCPCIVLHKTTQHGFTWFSY